MSIEQPSRGDGCRLDHTWSEIREELVRGTMEAKLGGLGKLMNASYGVWICVNHWCAPSTGDYFCFVYHEIDHHFVPWGPNSELHLITGQMEGTRSAHNSDANDGNANFQLLDKNSRKQPERHHQSRDRARRPPQTSVEETTDAMRAKTKSSTIASGEKAQDGK